MCGGRGTPGRSYRSQQRHSDKACDPPI
jgi:hypothetical protein